MIYIYGIRPIIEAIKSGKTIYNILIQEGYKKSNYIEIFNFIKKKNIPLQIVNSLNHINNKNHQGIIAYISQIHYSKIDQLLPRIYEKGKNPLLLILDSITDVKNFGAIIRTAASTGVNAIIFSNKNIAPINADSIKTSSGCLFKIPICKENNLKKTILYIKNYGIHIVAATEKKGFLWYENDFSIPTAIILGSEKNGISSSILVLCNKKIKLPMQRNVDSLNVSVACGAILYEAVRQRKLI
ncbi:MAG: 23S rRNA (guanosine(2251)-2'-O)-methyltransferase RlmB [Candidatus Bostrichicola ureolyticus]|nr:MAG: 23S rRNA (guanosine(2251)-2'-O)-methyltransferase RlmB [Candidatus Bostrichicola ureolyticus]